MLTCGTDLRGKGRWTPADYERKADLWIVASSWTEKPVKDARTLAHVQPVIYELDGKPAGDLSVLLSSLPRLNVPTPLWTSDDGRQTIWPIDLTQRGVVSQLADRLARQRLQWADGLLLDYFVALGWAYPNLYSEDFWQKWNNALRAWVEQMRTLRPDWVFVGQVHQLTDPCGALNGLYTEQDLTSFGTTPAQHAGDISAFLSLSRMTGREVVCVAELREPGRYPQSYRDAFKAWCEANGAYASVGRDQFAGQTL